MKATLLTLLFTLSIFTSTTQARSEKKLSVGLGTYAVIVAYSDPFTLNDEFSGIAVSATYATSNNMAFKATYYTLENNTVEVIDNTGYDLLIYFGSGLSRTGFKAYIGGGIFTENWEDPHFNEKFNGLQINGGIGYNWDSVSLDLTVGAREPDDYDDPEFQDLGPTVASSSLLLSARF